MPLTSIQLPPMFMRTSDIERNNMRRAGDEELSAQLALSTGGNGGSWSEVNDPSYIISLECDIDELNDNKSGNTYLLERQKFQLNQIARSHEVLTHFRVTVAKTRSAGPGVNHSFANDIRSAMQSLQSVMNDRFKGEYTLSGKGTDLATAVTLTDLAYLGTTSAESADYDYYSGAGTGNLSYINANTTIDCATVTGQHACFEKMIRALRLAQSADPNNTSDPVFAQVGTLLDEANQEFGAALNIAGNIVAQIKTNLSDLEQAELSKTNTYNKIALSNPNEEFERWQRAKSQLEISRSLSAFVARSNAEFIEKILG